MNLNIKFILFDSIWIRRRRRQWPYGVLYQYNYEQLFREFKKTLVFNSSSEYCKKSKKSRKIIGREFTPPHNPPPHIHTQKKAISKKQEKSVRFFETDSLADTLFFVEKIFLLTLKSNFVFFFSNFW